MRIIIDGVQEGEVRSDPSYLNRAKIAVDGTIDGKERPPTLSQVLNSGSGIATTQSIIDLSSGTAIVAYNTDDNLWHFYGIAACAEQAETAMCAHEAEYACSAGSAGCACYAENSTYSESSMTTSGVTYQLGDEMCTWYPGCFYAWGWVGEGNWTMLPGYATGLYYSYDCGESYNIAEFDSSGYFTASVYTACMANDAERASYAQSIRCVYWDEWGTETCADLYISFDPCTYCWSSMDLTVGLACEAGGIRAQYDDGSGQYSSVNFTYNTMTGYVDAPCLSVECASHAFSADYSAEAWKIFDTTNSVYVEIYGDPSGSTPPYFENTAWQVITIDGQDYTVLVSTMCAS